MTSLERDRIPSPRPIAVREVPLVDRIEEMNELRDAVYRAVHGEGGLVFVYGEAGIGKTRLIRELAAYARSRGVQVLYGRCPALFRMDGVPPYILWKEIIRDYLDTCTLEQLQRVIGFYPAEVANLVPELSRKLRSIPQSLHISPEHEQNRLFEAVSELITNISQENPLLVVLDDLQWTDQSSLLLLHYLARGLARKSLLLLGAYRSTEIDSKHALTPVLSELNRERLPESIQLKRMPLSDVSELIKSILEQEDVPVKLCELIYEKTKGNPFFVEEVVKSLKEDDVIFREDNRWKFKDISKIEFPETVRNVLKTRFSRLDDECQNVLTLASFVGNDFTLEAISALTQIDEGRLLELMDRILKTGLIKEREVRGEGVCSFADILVRDVVYEEVSLLKRKKLHGVVGSALEKVYAGKLDEHLGELAYHFLEGGNKEKALDYFMKAGEKSARIFANAEAASNFESALRLLEEKKGVIEEKARVLEILGDKKKLVGEYKSCLDNWNEALLLWKGLDEKKRVAELHRKVAFVLWHEFGNVEKAQENFDMAIKILDTMPESVELATLYSEKARISYFTKDVTEALSWSRRGLEIATRLNAFETIASTYVNMALVFGATGDNVKQSECLKKALEIALHNDYVDVALRAYNNTANMFASEESGRALEYWEKGFELARKVGDIDWISWIGSALSGVYFSMGNTSKALLLAEESETLSRKSGNLNSLHLSLGYLGLIYHVLGEWNKSEQYVKEAFDISQKLGNIQSSFRSYALLGWFHLDRDDYRKAKEYFEKGREITQKAGMLDIELTASQWIASTSAELGEIEKANNLIGKSLNFALEKQNKELLANAHVSKAVVLRIERKWNESIEYFEKGLKEHEALGARRFNVYFFAKLVLIEYARVYLERNQEGDKEKARDLFNQALEIFQKMGAKKDIEKVEASLLYIETGKPTSMLKPTDVVATGYPSLDNLLYGGIPTNYSVILTSPSCDERDLLINSFLETGLNKGEAVFYVTTNASSAKTLAEISSPNLQLFVCNPEAEAIIKDSSNAHMIKGVENLTEISIALASTINRLDPTQKGSRRVCLGIVSDVLLQHHAVETRRWLTALITRLKSEGFTILGIMDPEMHSLQDSCVILDLFDGIVSICERQTEKGVERFLKIKKMRNKKYREDELPLKG